jgi:hypothetical protein
MADLGPPDARETLAQLEARLRQLERELGDGPGPAPGLAGARAELAALREAVEAMLDSGRRLSAAALALAADRERARERLAEIARLAGPRP